MSRAGRFRLAGSCVFLILSLFGKSPFGSSPLEFRGTVKHLDKSSVSEPVKQVTRGITLQGPMFSYGTQYIQVEEYRFILEYLEANKIREKQVVYKGRMNGVLANGDSVAIRGRDQGGVLVAAQIYDLKRNAWLVNKG